jgi:hypothetical protein
LLDYPKFSFSFLFGGRGHSLDGGSSRNLSCNNSLDLIPALYREQR